MCTMLLQYVVPRTPVLYDPKVACCDVLSDTLFPVFSLFLFSQDVVWMISNITAGNRHHIECVVDAGLIPAVIDIMIRVRDTWQLMDVEQLVFSQEEHSLIEGL